MAPTTRKTSNRYYWRNAVSYTRLKSLPKSAADKIESRIDQRNDQGHISATELAEMMSVGRKAAEGAIADLINAGFLHRVKRGSRNGGASVYELHLPACFPTERPSTEDLVELARNYEIPQNGAQDTILSEEPAVKMVSTTPSKPVSMVSTTPLNEVKMVSRTPPTTQVPTTLTTTTPSTTRSNSSTRVAARVRRDLGIESTERVVDHVHGLSCPPKMTSARWSMVRPILSDLHARLPEADWRRLVQEWPSFVTVSTFIQRLTEIDRRGHRTYALNKLTERHVHNEAAYAQAGSVCAVMQKRLEAALAETAGVMGSERRFEEPQPVVVTQRGRDVLASAIAVASVGRTV